MTQKFTAEEVRANIAANRRYMTTETELQLTAYADTLSKPAYSGRVGEAAKLAGILDGLHECGYDLENLYVTDPADGDCFVARAADLLREFAALAAQGQGAADLAGYVDTEQVADMQRNGGGVLIGSFSERYGRTVPVYFHPAPPASPAGVPDVISEVMAELEKAIRKFPTWPTDPLHAVGVFNEEAGELSKAVLQQVYEPHKNATDDVQKEARQAAAMALRFLVSIDSYDWTPGTQHEQPSLAATPLTIIQDGEVSAADFAAAMRSCGLSLKTFAEVDREARRVAKERAAAPSAPEGDGGAG